MEGICLYAVGGIGTGSVMEGKVSLEIVCRDLQRMIREEARSAALAGNTCVKGGLEGRKGWRQWEREGWEWEMGYEVR